MSKAQAARLFDVSLSSVKRYTRTIREGGSLTLKKGHGRPPKIVETPLCCVGPSPFLSKLLERSPRRGLTGNKNTLVDHHERYAYDPVTAPETGAGAQRRSTTPWRRANTSACSLECTLSLLRMLDTWLRSVLTVM